MAQLMKKFLGAIGLESEPDDYDEPRTYDEDRSRRNSAYYEDEDEYETRAARNNRRNGRGDDRDAYDARSGRDYEDYDRTSSRYAEPDVREQRRRGGGGGGGGGGRGGNSGTVLPYPGSQPDVRHHMAIYPMQSYDDARVVIDDLLEDRSVLINLEDVDVDVSQRIVDMLSGATYALGASLKKAAANTYLLAPQSVDVSGAYEEDESPRRGGSFFGRR